MSKFLDQHGMGSATPEMLKNMLKEPRDELGVLPQEIYYNKEENKIFCVTDAPSKEAVEKSHNKAGIKTDWIIEVKSSKT
ncbi:MAG: DUF4242 domain-containing protein [Methanotrichaceae archaeon]|nr:DUF4242 domain-containing protein [Methanotrichaceae archaeon]